MIEKIVIITGANRGLGKALIDFALKDERALIFSLSRSLHPEHESFSEDKLRLLKTDLSEPFNDLIFEEILNKTSKNSSLFFFNNASVITPIDKTGNYNRLDIAKSIKINIEYPVNFINSFMRIFDRNKKIIINISSGAGNTPISYWSLYCASKAYLKMFCNVLESENIENDKIEIYSIDPGVIDTGMQESIRSNYFPSQEYFIALKNENELTKPATAALNIFNKIKF